MAKKKGGNRTLASVSKKTRQGNSKFTKCGHKGGGPKGSTTSKCYKKKYRGQGK
jgi:hypothetical protein